MTLQCPGFVFLLILPVDLHIHKILPSAALKNVHIMKIPVFIVRTQNILLTRTLLCANYKAELHKQLHAPAVLNLSANLASGTKWK